MCSSDLVRCTGKITLDVVFGSQDNYRSEEVTFQVAPFGSGYRALLGREAFTIFQAIPNYGYMKLKMPGPNRIITLVSDPDIALHAENKIAALVLSPIVEGFRLTKVLMDSGSGLTSSMRKPFKRWK